MLREGLDGVELPAMRTNGFFWEIRGAARALRNDYYIQTTPSPFFVLLPCVLKAFCVCVFVFGVGGGWGGGGVVCLCCTLKRE